MAREEDAIHAWLQLDLEVDEIRETQTSAVVAAVRGQRDLARQKLRKILIAEEKVIYPQLGAMLTAALQSFSDQSVSILTTSTASIAGYWPTDEGPENN